VEVLIFHESLHSGDITQKISQVYASYILKYDSVKMRENWLLRQFLTTLHALKWA